MQIQRTTPFEFKNTQIASKPQAHQGTSPIMSMHEFIETIRMVDLDDPDAKLNATTISDGKGGRILL